MKEIKIGRITLSFIFISLGIILLLDKVLNYKIIKIIPVFWPIVIVFFGFEIIYSYIYIKKDKDTKKKTDVVSILIIIVFISVLGLSNIPKTYTQYRYSDNISEEVILKDIKKIVIDDSNIDISIRESKDGHSKVRLEGVYKYNKREDKEEKIKHIKQDNKERVAKISRNNDKSGNVKNLRERNVKYFIEIQNGIEIDLISNYGDIDIEDIKNKIYIISNYGDVKLENVDGNVNIENSYGDFKGDGINGTIFIRSNNGDISITSSKIKENNVDIYCDFGDVKMELPKEQIGKFNIITNYGDIHDELKFDIIESASTKNINQVRKKLRPNFNIRVNNGDIILKED